MSLMQSVGHFVTQSLNESPSEKEGKFFSSFFGSGFFAASMKVPPKRKGNSHFGRPEIAISPAPQ